MPDSAKKYSWFCYGISFLLFAAFLLWGLSGVLAGGGLGFRIFGFYGIIPGILGISGLILGLKNAPAKWLYPVLAALAAQAIYWILFRHRFSIIPANIYFIIAFPSALFGVSAGLFIDDMKAKYKARLKMIAKFGAVIGFIVALIHTVHAFTLDRVIEYVEISFQSPKITPELDGYQIAFITDTHRISEQRLQGVVDELNQRAPDLVVLGGDFSTIISEMQRTVEILSHIEAVDGIFGVEGNHDSYRHLFAAMRAHGMTPLPNSGVHIRENFFLAGVEDLWNRNPNISEALADSQAEDFVLLISHNPDVTMSQDTTGADLVLSGHTHGGQISFFGIWAPYFTFDGGSITGYGQRFRAGWAESRDGVPVFVSQGTGEYLPRVFARPQVILITLVQE